MKKTSLLIIAAILIVAIAACALAACDKKGSEENSDVSRFVTALHTGENSDFAVSVETGGREKTFIADGKATDVTDFAEITVIPLKSNEFTEIPFTLSSEGGSLSGTLKDNGFGEFRSEIALDFVPSKVLVGEEGKQSEIALADVLAGKLGWSDAVNIARKEFADRTATESADGDKSREVYVKLITGDRKTYYYYVAFIGKGVDYWAVLLDPVDGTVISKK